MVIACRQWTLAVLLVSIIPRSGKSQIPMGVPMPPMFMPPPPMPMYAPPPTPMPALPPAMPLFMPPPPPMIVRIKVPPKPTTTTTTTTEKSAGNSDNDNNFVENGIAIPFPMPVPIQIGVPAMPPPMFCRGKSRHKGCPPCPPCICAPSCTPAFFSYCSPCHKKCRCRNKDDTPVPRMPSQVPEELPGPAYAYAFPPPSEPVLIPLHKLYDKKKNHHVHEKRAVGPESEESENSDSEYSREKGQRGRGYRSRRRRPMPRRRRHHYYRKTNRMDTSEEFVRPEIAYISRDGEVKLSRPLSNAEAANLLGEGNFIYPNDTKELRTNKQKNKQKETSRVQVIATNNPGHSQLIVMQDKGTPTGNTVINKKRMLRSDMTPEYLASGKKHLIFKPPPDKTISNISVSFMVT